MSLPAEDTGYSFPLDIERKIFEGAAIRDSKLIPTLLRVCPRVHAWIEPLLYRVLVIDDLQRAAIVAAQSKPANLLQHAVRHVFLHQPLINWEMQRNLLSNCSAIINLYVDGEFDFDLLHLLDKVHLQKLSLSVPRAVSDWCRSTLHHRLFLSVTHLELFQMSGLLSLDSRWDDWSPLASLPALTHLCLSREFPSEVLPRALAEYSCLALAVDAFWAEDEQAIEFVGALTISDPRLVVMVIASYRKDWEIGAYGGDDFWARAEKFVSQKSNGEIASNCYLLDETDM